MPVCVRWLHVGRILKLLELGGMASFRFRPVYNLPLPVTFGDTLSLRVSVEAVEDK
jgi:hypothetical protein